MSSTARRIRQRGKAAPSPGDSRSHRLRHFQLEMQVFRLHSRQREAWNYQGAFVTGGRWNPGGTAMIYTAQSLSLACLEVLVHLTAESVTGRVRLFDRGHSG